MKHITIENVTVSFRKCGAELTLSELNATSENSIYSPYIKHWIEEAKKDDRYDVLYGASRLALAYVYEFLPPCECAIFDEELSACGDSIVCDKTGALSDLWKQTDFDELIEGLKQSDIGSYTRLALLSLTSNSPVNTAYLVPFLTKKIEDLMKEPPKTGFSSRPSGYDFQSAFYDNCLRKESEIDYSSYVYCYSEVGNSLLILSTDEARRLQKECLSLFSKNYLVCSNILSYSRDLTERLFDLAMDEFYDLFDDDVIDRFEIEEVPFLCLHLIRVKNHDFSLFDCEQGDYPTWPFELALGEEVRGGMCGGDGYHMHESELQSAARDMLMNGAVSLIHVPGLFYQLREDATGWPLRHPNFPWSM